MPTEASELGRVIVVPLTITSLFQVKSTHQILEQDPRGAPSLSTDSRGGFQRQPWCWYLPKVTNCTWHESRGSTRLLTYEHQIPKRSCGHPPRLKLSQNVFSYVLYHPYAQLGRLGHLRTAWKVLNTFMQATELNPGSQRRSKWPRHWVQDSAYRLINLIVHTVGINATTVANRHPVSLC